MVLVFGGMLIFPMPQLLLRRMGRPFSLAKGRPMNGLAMQIALTVPFSLPLVAAAALYRLVWFYPAFMMVSVRTICRSYSFTGCGNLACLQAAR
jgi:hypothetical protein